jgi:hypothetical protein
MGCRGREEDQGIEQGLLVPASKALSGNYRNSRWEYCNARRILGQYSTCRMLSPPDLKAGLEGDLPIRKNSVVTFED